MLTRRDLFLASAATALTSRLGFAADPPTAPIDGRLKLRTLDDYFPFTPPKTAEVWAKRRAEVRLELAVANGVHPMPEKTPLNPVVHGKIEKDGYTIEKVFFASTPGHYVTGNLYRPAKADGKCPGVLFAHGHWANGRFHDAGEKAAEQSVKSKGEPDHDRGRYFIQAIPVQLARMGFVVFQYDMVGYADSTAIVHREGFKDAEAELRLQSHMGLQTWNSIRALDFLEGLPDVDPKKLGMTGASGGGTQTFVLAALDDRLAAVFPAVMVSTAMQGGCVCENCSFLRTGTGNVEIAALFAPKPMALSAADDWTKEFLTKGFPELQALYKLLGAEDKVAAKAWLQYGHNYNVHAREFMYAWFAKHLQGKEGPVTEAAYQPTPVAALSVFDASHPRPADELDATKLRAKLTAASDAQIGKLAPAEYRTVAGSAFRVMVGGGVPEKIAIRSGPVETKLPGGVTMHHAAFGREGQSDVVTAAGVFGPNVGPKVVLWLHPQGRDSLVANGDLIPTVKPLVAAGYAVVAPSLFGTGGKRLPVDKVFAGFTYGYNRPPLANRIHDIFTMLTFAKTIGMAKSVDVIGWGECGIAAVLAKGIAGDALGAVAADLNQFRFETIAKTDDPMLLPGAVKYGGLAGMLALCAPGRVLAHNHKGTASGKLPKAAYETAGAADKLVRSPEKWDDAKVVEWVIKQG